MKRTISLICSLPILLGSYAVDYIENFSMVSNDYVGNVKDLQILRMINGGSVIIPDFDSSCPEEMKGPFEYACKIVEEYMPTCMPLRVAVSCESLDDWFDTTDITVSSVRSYTPFYYDSAIDTTRMKPLSQLKGMIVGEMGHNEYESHFGIVPDVAFLTENPDITIAEILL